MRVLWICGSRIVGGAERATLQILALLRERGHAVRAVHPPKSDLALALEKVGIRSHDARLGGATNPRSIHAISRTVRELDPEITLVTTPNEWMWSCLMEPWAKRGRLVLVRHMALPLAVGVRWLANLRADAIIAVSEAVRRSLLGPLGIREKLIHVIPNPVRFTARGEIPSAQARAHARESLGLSAAGRWIGFFGGLEQRKGIGDLMQAALQVKAKIEECNILICGRTGGGGRGKAVELRTPQQGLFNRTHYLGEIEEVDRAITAVEAVVIATHSSLGEGLPLIALEAMACGTPVAGYAIGGVKEAIGGSGDSGLLVAPDDPDALAQAVLTLLTDRELAAHVATRGLSRAREMFAPALAADRYEGLFFALLQG
jgi:glycosyltransferase involved in cell wall biosynthesis